MFNLEKNERIIIEELNRVLDIFKNCPPPTDEYEYHDFYYFMKCKFKDDMYIVNKDTTMEMAFFWTGISLIGVLPHPNHIGPIGYERVIVTLSEDDGFLYVPEFSFDELQDSGSSWYNAENFNGVYDAMKKVNAYLIDFKNRTK